MATATGMITSFEDLDAVLENLWDHYSFEAAKNLLREAWAFEGVFDPNVAEHRSDTWLGINLKWRADDDFDTDQGTLKYRLVLDMVEVTCLYCLGKTEIRRPRSSAYEAITKEGKGKAEGWETFVKK